MFRATWNKSRPALRSGPSCINDPPAPPGRCTHRQSRALFVVADADPRPDYVRRTCLALGQRGSGDDEVRGGHSVHAAVGGDQRNFA
jgi:hypothetical protein